MPPKYKTLPSTTKFCLFCSNNFPYPRLRTTFSNLLRLLNLTEFSLKRLNSVKSCILISNFNMHEYTEWRLLPNKKMTWTEMTDNASMRQNTKNMKVIVFVWSADSSPFWLTSLVKEMKIEKIYEILLNILKFKFIDLLSSIPAISEIKNAY